MTRLLPRPVKDDFSVPEIGGYGDAIYIKRVHHQFDCDPVDDIHSQ
jgi:hypothetical protein